MTITLRSVTPIMNDVFNIGEASLMFIRSFDERVVKGDVVWLLVSQQHMFIFPQLRKEVEFIAHTDDIWL